MAEIEIDIKKEFGEPYRFDSPFNKFDAERFVIDSHRGAFKSGLLENSIPAFLESFYEGANVLETDIRLTRDNQIVLIHNGTIDHIAGFATKKPDSQVFHETPIGRVREHTWKYLKEFEFPNNAKILNIETYLEFLKIYRLGAQIELKEPGYEEKILEKIAEADIPYDKLLGPIVCTSFNYFAVKKLVKLAPKYDIPLYKPSSNFETNSKDFESGLAIGFQALPTGAPIYGRLILKKLGKMGIWGGMTYYKQMPIRALKRAHLNHVKFCPRVPDDEKLINAYLDAGVDGFETDNVPLIRKMAETKGMKLWPIPNRTNK